MFFSFVSAARLVLVWMEYLEDDQLEIAGLLLLWERNAYGLFGFFFPFGAVV